MERLKVLPYKRGSTSARAVAEGLGVRRIKLEGSRVTSTPRLLVLNWGNSQRIPPNLSHEDTRFINHPHAVGVAANKGASLSVLKEMGVRVPPFTNSRQEALEWLSEDRAVFERHKLTGNSGEGIRICEPGDVLQDAPLYTKYIPKKQEYRIHVGRIPQTSDYKVISRQRKGLGNDIDRDTVDWRIRNHTNGFIFTRFDGHDIPHCVIEEAIKAVESLQLDFGAVDVGYQESSERAYVYEVNTACGVTGTTLQDYIEYFNLWRWL